MCVCVFMIKFVCKQKLRVLYNCALCIIMYVDVLRIYVCTFVGLCALFLVCSTHVCVYVRGVSCKCAHTCRLHEEEGEGRVSCRTQFETQVNIINPFLYLGTRPN